MRLLPALTIAVALVLSGAVVAARQDPGVPAARFEVASVKPNTSEQVAGMIRTPPDGSINATNVTLTLLLRYSFGLKPFEIDGLPRWADADRFDIVARPAVPVGEPIVRAMIRSLLADRFALRTHTATRDMPVLALVLATPGRAGPDLQHAVEPCQRTPTEPCGVKLAAGRITATAVSMTELASALELLVNRPVLDETGLPGLYSAQIGFSPESVQVPWTTPGDAGPSLFTALRERLGLKLDTRRAPMPILVIDAVEHPTAN